MSTSPRSRPSLTASAALVAASVLLLTGCAADAPATEDAAPTAPAASVAPEPTPAAPATEPAPSTEAAPAEPSPAATVEATAAADEVVITIVDFSYEMPVSVAPGATVTVVNEDSEAHTLTSVGAFDVTLTAGESESFTAPEEPGEYRIICLLHGNMTATLVVA